MTSAPDQTAPDPQAPEAPPTATTKYFPSAYTVLAIVTVFVWLLAFVIPAGTYQRNDDGQPIEGTYQRVASPEDFGQRLQDLFVSPVNGLYGIQDTTGFVSPDNSGDLF